MHVALHGRHQNLAGLGGDAAGVLLHIGHEEGDRLLHDAGRFHHLRQEHLARSEQISDDVHARHQRTFDHVERAAGGKARFFHVHFHKVSDAVDERMFKPLVDGLLAPGKVRAFGLLRRALEAVGQSQQAFG